MKDNKKFAVGDLVVRRVRISSWHSCETWGTVARVTSAGTIFVEEKGEEVNARKGADLRHPSEYEVSHREWFHSLPRDFTYLDLKTPYGINDRFQCEGFSVGVVVKTPEDCAELAAELARAAAWLGQEPESKPEES